MMASSGDICDFEPDTYTAAQDVTLHGISSGLLVTGIGYVNWTCTDTIGKPVTLCIHAIHIPGLAIQLLSLQQLITELTSSHTNSFIGRPKGMIIIYCNKVIRFPYNTHTHLPMCKTNPGIEHFTTYCTHLNALSTNICPTPFYLHVCNAYPGPPLAAVSQALHSVHASGSPELTNPPVDSLIPVLTAALSKPQCDLLCIHYHFGHIGFCEIQAWACNGLYAIPQSLAT